MAGDGDGLPGASPIPERAPVDPARLAEVRPGRVFEHRALTNPSNPGPQFCRIIACTNERVAFHEIHRLADGSEREPLIAPWNVPAASFFEFDLGRRHGGPLPALDSKGSGYDLPLIAKKPGTSGPGHG